MNSDVEEQCLVKWHWGWLLVFIDISDNSL